MSARQYAIHTQIPTAQSFSRQQKWHTLPCSHRCSSLARCTRQFEDIKVEFPGRHGRAHDSKSFSCTMALPRRLMAAQKAMDQSKAGKTLKLLVPSRVRASSCRIVKRCSGLTQEAKIPQIQSIGLSWWEFRPGSSKSANWNPHLQLPSSCLQIVK